MVAIIADIHSNLEALEAVLADIEKRGIKEIYFVGDIVGYGPNPKECIDIASGFKVSVLGNHDEAALFESEAIDFDKKAIAALDWTRGVLEDPRDAENNKKRWDFLGEMPRSYNLGDILFVHGSPRNPVREYLFPEYVIENPKKLGVIFENMPCQICFTGHSHLPGIFTEDLKYASSRVSKNFSLNSKRAMVNVGSVGQPRDRNPEACYVVYDLGTKKGEWIRVLYDVKKTMKKIRAIPELDGDLANRLAEGR